MCDVPPALLLCHSLQPKQLQSNGVQMVANPANPFTQEYSQQQQQQHLQAHHPYAAGPPYGQQYQTPQGGYPYPQQQQQQYGTPFAAQLPSGYPAQGQQQRMYAQAPQFSGQAQPTSVVPVQQL
jgi:hypothetical protein